MSDNQDNTSTAGKTVYRDEEKILRDTERTNKYALAWSRHKNESLSDYLSRLGNRGAMKVGTDRQTTMLDGVLKGVVMPLGTLAWRLNRSSLAVQARSLNGGYQYCCCTDVKRLTTNFMANTTANMTLAELQRSAEKGCLRCWYIVECIASFADHWANIPPPQIIVTAGKDAILGSGSVLVFTVFWVEPTKDNSNWQFPKWSKLPLEIYYHRGGFPLYPTLKPRENVSYDVDADHCAGRISEWIEVCTASHTFCNTQAVDSFTPTRLIDVSPLNDRGDVHLVGKSEMTDTEIRFTALSYRWGLPAERMKQIPMTTKTTIATHVTAVPWDILTTVFQDAITLTRQLGLQYIWIDALCIIQDDAEDWARETSQMASVYGEAHLVIAATSSLRVDESLFRHRSEPVKISRLDKLGQTQSVFVRKEVDHDAFTTGEPRHFDSTPLFARAWCFQERLLARRVIHFAEHELLFECKEDLKCECNMLDTGYGLYQNFKVICAYGLAKTSAKNRYQTWYSILRPFTARSLTFEKDRLPAISGFARLVSVPEMGPYHAGMWENELPAGLLWRVVRALPENNGVIDRPATYRAPTWSWAGIQAVVDGHIQFHDCIETVATVQEVQCTSTSSNLFGEIVAGHIILKAPTVKINIRERKSDDTPNNDAVSYHRSRSRSYEIFQETTKPDEIIPFEADLPLDQNPGSGFLALAIEHDTKGIYHGRWSCLVLLRRQQTDSVELDCCYSYCRVGTVDLPSHWISRDSSDKEDDEGDLVRIV